MRGVNGVHHITAIAGPAQENLDFYAGVLGMRLVKRSVNHVRGLHGAQLRERDCASTKRFLTDTLGFEQLAAEGGWTRGASAPCIISPGASTTRRIRRACRRGSSLPARSRRR